MGHDSRRTGQSEITGIPKNEDERTCGWGVPAATALSTRLRCFTSAAAAAAAAASFFAASRKWCALDCVICVVVRSLLVKVRSRLRRRSVWLCT